MCVCAVITLNWLRNWLIKEMEGNRKLEIVIILLYETYTRHTRAKNVLVADTFLYAWNVVSNKKNPVYVIYTNFKVLIVL